MIGDYAMFCYYGNAYSSSVLIHQAMLNNTYHAPLILSHNTNFQNNKVLEGSMHTAWYKARYGVTGTLQFMQGQTLRDMEASMSKAKIEAFISQSAL